MCEWAYIVDSEQRNLEVFKEDHVGTLESGALAEISFDDLREEGEGFMEQLGRSDDE
jgi:hypothetical protein